VLAALNDNKNLGRSGREWRTSSDVKRFKAPRTSFGDTPAETAARLVSAAAELALVIDENGVIRDLSCGDDAIARVRPENWVGRPWIETVTIESRPKIQSLLVDATFDSASRWRQVNHRIAGHADLPLLYSTIRLPGSGHVLAIGRDLTIMSVLQQSLLEAQQAMEREYIKLNNTEARYRLLFRTTPEATLVVDAATRRITEANPASAALLGMDLGALPGQSLAQFLDIESMRVLEMAEGRIQVAGKVDGIALKLQHDGRAVLLSAALFRQDSAAMFLLRLTPQHAAADAGHGKDDEARLARLVAQSTDAVVITDGRGQIMSCNPAFLDLTQVSTPEQARLHTLDRWLGRSGVDLDVMIGSMRQHGSVRLFGTTLRGEHGASTQIEISAVSILNGNNPCFGFTMRDVSRRLETAARSGGAVEPVAGVPRSLEQISELIGRVPLKELVRESTGVIERMAIEAALQLTNDNRASAAELLGVSRQSLYMKLRRYGLGDLGPEPGLAETTSIE
jgi:transcriptional regulator PpsR